MRLANAWAEEYVASRMDSMQQYTRTTEQLLMEQVKSLQQEIGDKEKALHDMSFEKKIIKVDKNHSMASEKLTQVNAALISASRDKVDAQIRYQALKSTNKESIPEVLHHPFVQQKKNEFDTLQHQYTVKSRIYKSDYPEMIRLREQMNQANSELAKAYDDAYQEVLASTQGQLQQASIKENALKSQLQQSLQENADASREELDYDQIQMEIDNKKALLSVLLQKQNQTDVTAQMQEKAVPASRIIEYAEVPKFIFSPNITRIMLLSLLVGFAGSIGLALLLEYFDRSLRTPEDVERQLHLPFLGMVPHYALGNGNGHRSPSKPKELPRPAEQGEKALDRYVPYRLSVSDIGSSASEALKTVRTSFLLAFPGSPPRSVLITSSRAGEGKTFISCNLAVALTQLNKRVILIDADMRNPHIHKVWNIPNDRGLSIFLTSDVSSSSVMQPSPVPTLSLMASGPKTPRPAELLASERFGELLRELESKYDFVIVDSPPILPVTDSVILASRVQSVLMVVRGGVTPRDVVKMAKKKLSSSNGVIAGTVLNGIDMTDPYYYYRYYSDYYSDYYGPSEGHPNKNGNNHNGG
jgi:capsular exopolysaccharide synthesis family protein